MGELNTVGQKSVAESKKGVNMGNLQPSFSQARNYRAQGCNGYVHLGRGGGASNRPSTT